MATSSLTDTGRIAITKLMYENLEFYLAFGKLPTDYIDTWDIDEETPSYIAKKIQDESVQRSSLSNLDYVLNKEIHTALTVYSEAVSAIGNLNGYLDIVANPGTLGNVQVVITPGGIAGSESINFASGILSVSIENNVTTRQTLANILQNHSLILSASALTNPTSPITVGNGSDNTFLVGGKDLTNYIENVDYKIGYINNADNIPLGGIKWLTTVKPSNNQTYKVSYWHKSLLSVEQSLLNIIGFKKSITKNYVIEDENGSIRANDKKWSISANLTKHLALSFFVDNEDIPDGTVIRQFGLYSNVIPKVGFQDDHFYAIDQIESTGSLVVIENMPPYKHQIINSQQINIVLSL